MEDSYAIIGCSTHGPPLRFGRGFQSINLDSEDILKSWERIIEERTKNIYILTENLSK